MPHRNCLSELNTQQPCLTCDLIGQPMESIRGTSRCGRAKLAIGMPAPKEFSRHLPQHLHPQVSFIIRGVGLDS